MTPARRGWSVAVVTLLAVSLAGCSDGIDAGEARLCRIVAAGQAGPDADRLSVVATRSTEHGIGANGRSAVEIVYEISAGEMRRRHVVGCLFVRQREGEVQPRHLVGLELDGRRMGGERLHLTRRFWLELPESAGADPEPIAGLSRAPEVPRRLAVALQMAISGLPQAGIYIVLALANALVLGLAGRVNLAYGEIAAFGGYGAALGATVAGGTGAPGVAIVAGLVAGVWTAGGWAGAAGRTVFEPLASRRAQASLIASLSVAVVLGEIARLAQGSGARPGPPLLDSPLAFARSGDLVVTATPMTLVSVGLASMVAVAVLVGMQQSRFGRTWRAVADDPLAARLLGVDPRRLAVTTYGLAGILAGVAGTLVTLAAGGVTHGTGLVVGLKAVIAAVLGGSGSLGGAVLAALLIGAVETVWSALLPIEHRDAAVLVLVSAVLVRRAGGLAGSPDLERRE